MINRIHQTEFAKVEFDKFNHELIPALKCIYYPQIGFLVAIPVLVDRVLEEQINLSVSSLSYQVI